jgi:hypothetical protein
MKMKIPIIEDHKEMEHALIRQVEIMGFAAVSSMNAGKKSRS